MKNQIVKNVLQGLTTASGDTLKSYVSVGYDIISEMVKDKLPQEFTADEAVIIGKAMDVMTSKAKKAFNERNIKPREVAMWRSFAFGLLQGMEATEIEEEERKKIREEWEAEDKKNREAAKERARERELKTEHKAGTWLSDNFKQKPGTWFSENLKEGPSG
jgi:hypothetical protein